MQFFEDFCVGKHRKFIWFFSVTLGFLRLDFSHVSPAHDISDGNRRLFCWYWLLYRFTSEIFRYLAGIPTCGTIEYGRPRGC